MLSKDDIKQHLIVKVNNATGVVVSFYEKDRFYVFTCKHVLDGITEHVVRYAEKSKDIRFEVLDTIVSEDPTSDVAILVVKSCGYEVPYVFPSSDKADCYHVALPLCRERSPEKFQSIRVSYISNFDSDDERFLIEYEYNRQIQKKEMEGTSGGGIFNKYGHLVGIHSQSAMFDDEEFLGKAVMIPVCHYLDLISRNNLPFVYKYNLTSFDVIVNWVFDFQKQKTVKNMSKQFENDILQYKKLIARWSPQRILDILKYKNKIKRDIKLESIDDKRLKAFTLFLVGTISFLGMDEKDEQKAIIELYDRFHYIYSNKEIDVNDFRDQLEYEDLIRMKRGSIMVVGGLYKTIFDGCYIQPETKVPDLKQAHIGCNDFDITIGKDILFQQISVFNNNIFEVAVEECAKGNNTVSISEYRNLLKTVIDVTGN